MSTLQSLPNNDPFHTARMRNVITGLLLCMMVDGAAQEVRFTILQGGDPVGHIRASRSVSGVQTSYFITSSTELWMIWKQKVRTSMSAEYSGGHLASSQYSMVLNNKMRDSSSMSSTSTGKWAYVHPNAAVPYKSSAQWSTARMYFDEPIGQTLVMVESVLRDCPIRHIGPGIYELTLPNNDRNRYTYVGGRLMEVKVDRTLISLVFRRA